MAVTYLLKHNDCIVAYFSVLNDRIAVEQFPSSSQFRKLQRLLPYRKRRYKSYPAVKLGRFAVGMAFAKQGIRRRAHAVATGITPPPTSPSCCSQPGPSPHFLTMRILDKKRHAKRFLHRMDDENNCR